MHLPDCRRTTATILFSIVIATTSLATSIDPLTYSEVQHFFPVQPRDLDCGANYFSCEDKGVQFAGTCCPNGQKCSLDAYQSPACCPTTATCTGVAPGAGPTQTAPYVSNSYFAFPVIPTSFSNAAACTSALQDCSNNYDACVSGLAARGGYDVTIQVPGTTVAPVHTTLPSATVTSVCSSLSLQGCHGLSNGLCRAGIQGKFTIGSENAAPRPTGACVAGVIAGLGVGIMGGQI